MSIFNTSNEDGEEYINTQNEDNKGNDLSKSFIVLYEEINLPFMIRNISSNNFYIEISMSNYFYGQSLGLDESTLGLKLIQFEKAKNFSYDFLVWFDDFILEDPKYFLHQSFTDVQNIYKERMAMIGGGPLKGNDFNDNAVKDIDYADYDSEGNENMQSDGKSEFLSNLREDENRSVQQNTFSALSKTDRDKSQNEEQMANLVDKKKKEVNDENKKGDQGNGDQQSATQNRNIMRSELRKVIGERSYVSQVQYMFFIGTFMILVIFLLNIITLFVMLEDSKYFDSYVATMKDFQKVFVSQSFFHLQMVKYFTLYYDCFTLNWCSNTSSYKIFDLPTFTYMNYEYDDEMDHIFEANIIELFTRPEAHMSFKSSYKTGVAGVDEQKSMTLFEFLYDLDPVMDNMKKSINPTGYIDLDTYMYKYSDRYYLDNFEETNIVGGWILHDLYVTNYNGFKNQQTLEQVTFATYIFLILCLGSTITLIKKVNYDVQNKMLFLFTRINKKDIKIFYII